MCTSSACRSCPCSCRRATRRAVSPAFAHPLPRPICVLVFLMPCPMSSSRARRAIGWLGLLLGSRLYFRVTADVLADDARYEAVVDDIVQEVRRRTPLARASSSGAARGGEEEQAAVHVAPQGSTTPTAAERAAPPRRSAASSGSGGGVNLTINNTTHSTAVHYSPRSRVHNDNSVATLVIL